MNPETPSVQINIFQGMDRVSSEQMLESSPERILYFPVVSTPLIMAMNFIDDNILGGDGKRPGFVESIAAPQTANVYAMVQYLYAGKTQNIAQIGNQIYMWNFTGTWTWTSIYTLSGSYPGVFKEFGGYLFYTNGHDPFLMWDGTYWYKIVSNCIQATTTQALGTSQTSVTVDAVGFQTNGNNFPPNGFLYYPATGEIMQYIGLTLLGNVIVGFPNLIRSYADTVAAPSTSITSGSNGQILPQSTIDVGSTTNFPTAGTVYINDSNGIESITYTGLTATTLTGCTGGTGTLSTGNQVVLASINAGATLEVWYGSPPVSPNLLGVTQTRLFAANTSTGPNNVYWTAGPREVTDPYNWIQDDTTTTTNQVFSGVDDASLSAGAGNITAIDDSGQNMLFYKGTQTYLMTVDNTNAPTQFILIDGSTGALSQKSISNIQNSQFSYGYNGVQVYAGSGLILLSKPIDDLAKGVPLADISQICSGAYDYKLFIAVPQTTEADRFGAKTYTNVIFVYNYLTTNWFIWQTPFQITCFKNMVDTNGQLQMYVGDSNGNVYVFNPTKSSPIYSDNGQDISCMLQTKYLYFNRQNYRKRFKDITVVTEAGQNGTIAFSLLSDKMKGDYVNQVSIPDYVNRLPSPDMSSYYYAMSYQITESSSAPFFLYSITQELEYMKGY